MNYTDLQIQNYIEDNMEPCSDCCGADIEVGMCMDCMEHCDVADLTEEAINEMAMETADYGKNLAKDLA